MAASRALLLLLVVVPALLLGAAAGPARLRSPDGDYDEADDYDDESDDEAPDATPGGPVVCPAQCVCRYDATPKLVDCSHRNLDAFPPPEEIPEDVEYLDLSDNAIRSVPRELPAWERLEGLALAGNQLTDFPARALSGLAALEMLDLSRNSIASLRHIRPDRFLADNPKLQVLNLSGNGLRDLGRGSFQSLSSESLLVLDVSRCAISSIDGEEALAEVPSLRVLRAHDNPLTQLPALRAPQLRELDVSGCRLKMVPAAALSALSRLQHLAVNRNPELAVFSPPPVPGPGASDHLSHLVNGTPPWSSSLQVLEAEDCALVDLSFLPTLPNLTELHLRGNSIAALEAFGLQDNGGLLHLDLADNKLEEVTADAFRGTSLLREVDLSGNKLAALHLKTFADHPALRSLNVSRNPIASLEMSAVLPSLRVLDASHAEILELAERALDGLPELRQLNLSHNLLASLPNRLVSGDAADSGLTLLDLSFCRLTDLGLTTLNNLSALQTLYLNGNRFTDPLKVASFSGNAALQNIQLDDNPWRCDCKSKDYIDLVDFLNAQPVKEDVNSLPCHGPEKAQGRTWYDACLSPDRGALASVDTWMLVVILALFVTATAGAVLAVQRLRRGKARRRRQQQQQEEEERHACEQEAARRRQHRRLQQQQQEELRRQSMRAQSVSTEDPHPHPPSYEEAVLMDRMTQDDPVSDSDSEAEDEAFQLEMKKKIARLSSASSRIANAIAEEDDEEDVEGRTSSDPATTISNGDSRGNQSNGKASRINTKL